EDLYGTGETGSHGGSGLSALGGTVRLGELVPGGTIRHSLKLNIDSANFYPGFGGYRWPAWKSDAGGAGYGGSIPEVRMGSLLAPKADFPIDTLETEPGKILAAAFRNYGGYIVDTSGWSIYNFVTERSPAVSVSGRLTDASGSPVAGRVVSLEWSADQTTWSSETQIGQFPAADASGTFTGRMAFRGSGDHSEFIRARFVGDATFATSLSLVV